MRSHPVAWPLLVLLSLAGCSSESLAPTTASGPSAAEKTQSLVPLDSFACEAPDFSPIPPNHFQTYQWHLGCSRYQQVAHVSALTAWDYTSGHAMLGFLDGGIATYTYANPGYHVSVHPELAGAFREHLSPSYAANLRAEGPGARYFVHGIHTMGLAAARMDTAGTVGLCPGCSTILGNVGIAHNNGTLLNGLIQGGAQAINLSLGITDPVERASAAPALSLAAQRDVAIVAAAGNWPSQNGTITTAVQWPASDTGLGVIAVAGTNQLGQPWNEYGNEAWQFDRQAASSFGPEVVISAPANSIYSTVYPAQGYLGTGEPSQPPCGDASPAGHPNNDGYGLCSGTSMSTPIVTGIVGLIRSVNPLLPVAAVRTALRTGATPITTPGFGAGLVNAQRAVEATLPTVGGVRVKNRLTPLFSLYSATATDAMYTTVPQYASASIQDQGRRPYSVSDTAEVGAPTPYASRTSDPLIAGYPGFPGAAGQAPTAAVFIFTTETNPLTQARDLVPLYRMSYVGLYGGNPDHRDHVYTTDQQGIAAYASVGYKLDGIEGYIFPNTVSAPPGTVRLLRRYNAARDDHAIFPETQLAAMQAEGYTQLSGNGWLGYVYPNVDSDNDGLIDGFEMLLGTNPAQADSDCDGRTDGAEVPLAALPLGDPLDGTCGNAASFVSQIVPSTVTAGQNFAVGVLMQNTGSSTWTQSQLFQLGSQNPQDNVTWGTSRANLGSAVQIAPGQSKYFIFSATAPSTPGQYNFQWRMVQGGRGFGDFSPNVVITVTAPPARAASFVTQSVPTTVAPGQHFTASITLQNRGSMTWTRSQLFRLGSQTPQDNRIWGINRVDMGATEQVAYGQQKAFTFTAVAPSTPGQYAFQWRMVQDGVEWFGDVSPNVLITVTDPPALSASFVDQSVPTTVTAGTSFVIFITMRNMGMTTWTSNQGIQLSSQNPQDNKTWSVNRGSLTFTDYIAPGNEKTFRLTAVAPATPGQYNFQWRMAQGGTGFGEFTPNLVITVTPPL